VVPGEQVLEWAIVTTDHISKFFAGFSVETDCRSVSKLEILVGILLVRPEREPSSMLAELTEYPLEEMILECWLEILASQALSLVRDPIS
jgi:hypothetical protein